EAGEARIAEIRKEHARFRERERALNQLMMFADFRELDWRPLTVEIERLTAERKTLEAASDVLRTLQTQLGALEERLADVDAELEDARDQRSKAEAKREAAENQLADACTLLDATPEEARARYFPKLEAMRGDALGEHRLTVESCDNRQSDMRDWLQRKIDAEGHKLDRLLARIVDAMRRYKNDWPVETSEVDVSIEAADEYRAMLEQLRVDDLPRFEKRFKELLNENTI